MNPGNPDTEFAVPAERQEYNTPEDCHSSETDGEADIRLADSLVVSNIHPAVFPAMTQSVVLSPEEIGALGIVETFSATSAMVAADVAAKAASVTIFRLSLAMAMGGKGLLMMTGSVADVEAAVQAAAEAVKEHGLLVSTTVIPRPSKELFFDYI